MIIQLFYSPFNTGGGNFTYKGSDPVALLTELHYEYQELQSSLRVKRERLIMCEGRLRDCRVGQDKKDKKGDISRPWLVAAAVFMALALLLMTTRISSCGGSFCLIIVAVLMFRWVAERFHMDKDKLNSQQRAQKYEAELHVLREEISVLNLRIAEVDSRIKETEKLLGN